MSTPARPLWRVAALALALAAPGAADANGRFPSAQQVVIGPGPRSDVIVLRVTFGLALSTDGGRSFHWLCEEGMYSPFVPTVDYDPSVEVDARGAALFGFENGLRHSSDGCGATDIPGTQRRTFHDLTSDPSGRTVYAVEATEGMSAALYRVDATTYESVRYPTALTGHLFDTIEVAPSNLQRLYVTGRAGMDFQAVLYRSDDGGRTLTRVPVAFAADALWLCGIDPTDPDTVYLRASMGLGTELRRSRDGGRTFQRIAATDDPMLGFAMSDDGRTLWYGSIEGGLQRSDDGGDSFRPVSPLPILCLRQHAGVLWACSDWETQPFALGRSRDRGATFEPVLQFNNDAQFQGPPTCAMRSEGAAVCVNRWPVIRRVFDDPGPALPDAGRPDVPRDVPPLRDAGSDAGLMDVTTPRDGGVSPPPTDSCGCAVPGRGARSLTPAALSVVALAAAARRRRFRRKFA